MKRFVPQKCASEMLDDIPADDQSSVNIVIDLNKISELLKCTFCGQAFTSMSSNSINGVYDINVRLDYGLRCIVLESLSNVSDASMKKAVEETVKINNSNRDMTAAFDGIWQKRGHTSLNGVVSATSL
ncbi:hypothetical protein TNCV_1189911 [Trichonephila clavipes]|nr:hypothetical protein TNCV_1189911 [Trichonephila clavipes]